MTLTLSTTKCTCSRARSLLVYATAALHYCHTHTNWKANFHNDKPWNTQNLVNAIVALTHLIEICNLKYLYYSNDSDCAASRTVRKMTRKSLRKIILHLHDTKLVVKIFQHLKKRNYRILYLKFTEYPPG